MDWEGIKSMWHISTALTLIILVSYENIGSSKLVLYFTLLVLGFPFFPLIGKPVLKCIFYIFLASRLQLIQSEKKTNTFWGPIYNLFSSKSALMVLKVGFCSLIQIRMDIKNLKLFSFLSIISQVRAIFHSFFACKRILLTCREQFIIKDNLKINFGFCSSYSNG